MHKYIGIDIGGTTCKVGLFSETELLSRWEIPTDKSRNILADIIRTLPEHITSAAIGVPGAVMPDGTVNRCVNLGWDICRPAEEFTAQTGIPCRIENDANLAALGEQWRGGGRGADSLLFVTLGTGVGGGLIRNGSLISGAHGAAGEIGHLCVNPAETEPCSCGRRGCLEQYCGAAGIVRLAGKAGIRADSSKAVFTLAEEGNAAALSVVDSVCALLGQALANICAVFDPEAVILGGGISAAGEFLRARVESSFRCAAFHACRNTPVRLAELGGDAGIYGAAKLAMT